MGCNGVKISFLIWFPVTQVGLLCEASLTINDLCSVEFYLSQKKGGAKIVLNVTVPTIGQLHVKRN
jgi:hypothetical protein